MANEYYDSTGAPANASAGNPGLIRAEFDAIEAGFDKLPTLTGNANEAVFVNAGATALETLSASDARTRLGVEASANKDASGGYVGLTLFKINFKNVLNTFTSFLTNSNTAERTYTFPDSSGTVALTSDMPLNGRKNWIINGDFMIWQRNGIHATVGYGSDDRWYVDALGTTFSNTMQEFTIGQTDVPDNPKKYCRIAVTTAAAAGNFCNKQHHIEGVHNLSGQDVTLSFYAKADAAKNISMELVQDFGTGGAPSADVTAIGVNKQTLTTGWVQYTFTISVPSIAGKTVGTNGDDYLGVIFWFDAGSDFDARTDTLGQQNGTFELSHVQLEAGTSATSFERRTPGEELELCCRYYIGDEYSGETPRLIFSGDVDTGDTYYGKLDLVVTMRAVPSVTLTNESVFRFPLGVGTTTVTAYSVEESRVCNSTGAAGYFISTLTADAEI